jgi:hypothetical protein
MKSEFSALIIIFLIMATALIGFQSGKLVERQNNLISSLQTENKLLSAYVDTVKSHGETLIWMRACISQEAQSKAAKKGYKIRK